MINLRRELNDSPAPVCMWIKGAVSRDSDKLGNYKMSVKLRET